MSVLCWVRSGARILGDVSLSPYSSSTSQYNSQQAPNQNKKIVVAVMKMSSCNQKLCQMLRVCNLQAPRANQKDVNNRREAGDMMRCTMRDLELRSLTGSFVIRRMVRQFITDAALTLTSALLGRSGDNGSATYMNCRTVASV